MRIRFAFGLIWLFLLFFLRPAANAQTVNGNNDAAFAVGKWKESMGSPHQVVGGRQYTGVPTKNLVGQPPEVIVLHARHLSEQSEGQASSPQKTKVRIANGHTGSFCIPTRAFAGQLRSGSFARVKVVQAADFRNLDHMTERRKLDGSADGRILFERQMQVDGLSILPWG